MFGTEASFGTLDGQDFMTFWGLGVEKGNDQFRQFNQPKAGYEYGYGNEDGVQFDLTAAVKKEARTFVLDVWLLANSVTDFNTKMQNLDNKLFSPGFRTIYCKHYNVTVKCKIKSFPRNVEAPENVPFLGTTFYGVQFSMEFIECMGV